MANSIGTFCFKGIRDLGAGVLRFLQTLGRLVWFCAQLLIQGIRGPIYGKQIVQQILSMGRSSLILVVLTALFTGMVLALQSYTAFERLHAEAGLPEIVALSMVRELGPVLTGLMMVGRLGASMASEIATMRVTEQLDALVTLSTDPLRYLIWPRLLASILVLPLFTLLANIVGVFGGYIIGVYRCHFHGMQYLFQTLEVIQGIDVVSGLVKAACFGLILAVISCYEGYYATNGAAGVGKATTHAVVRSCIVILLTNYFLTALFFSR